MTIRIFIGHDPREPVAYHVCCESILAHTKAQVAFYPIRGLQRDGSNSFTYERFLVPYRCGFSGRAIFLDGDMLVRSDIEELWEHWRSRAGVMVVKHDYQTKHPIKYLGYRNEDYLRKNWSSVMVWECGFYPNRVLTPEYVANQPGSHLHRFGWLQDEQIGALPEDWNVLIREREKRETDKLRHYTIGTPCFKQYAFDDADWTEMYERTISCADPA